MSRFWRHFVTNGKSSEQSVNELLEALGDACEKFYESSTLPRPERRRALLRELRKLACHYDHCSA
jgi:hypothetical protein